MRTPNNYIRIFMVLLFGALALNTTSVFANPMVIEYPSPRHIEAEPYRRAEATKVYQLPEVQAILATNNVCIVVNDNGAGMMFYQASGESIEEISKTFRKYIYAYGYRLNLACCLKMEDSMQVKPLTDLNKAEELLENMIEYCESVHIYDDDGRYDRAGRRDKNRAGRAKGYYELAIKPDPTNGDKIIATLCIALKKIR